MRYYICDVIGSGVRGDAYRPVIPGSALIPNHPEGHPAYGHAKFAWCLVRSLTSVNQERLTAIGGEVSSEEELRSQQVDQKTLQLLKFYGVDYTGCVDALDVLNRVRVYLS